VIEGANAWERLAAFAFRRLEGVIDVFAPRLQRLRQSPPQDAASARHRDQTQSDATFVFPYGDGYWSKLLNRSFCYEDELELLFRDSVSVDYTFIDCGANFGYWSVLVSSAPYGSHKAIAIEPSSQNFAKLKNNAEINGNRFE